MLLLLLSCFSRVRPCGTHRRQPTRLLCPWDSPGKNTGVGCHILLHFTEINNSYYCHSSSNTKMWFFSPYPVAHNYCTCMCVLSHFSRVQLFATLWTVAHQAPLSMRFTRQEYWSGLPCPPPADLPYGGTEPTLGFSPLAPPRKPNYCS